jgi:diguanylate cyclase (GGDEF)-like protein
MHFWRPFSAFLFYRKHKDEFIREIYKENLLRIIISSILLTISEIILLCFFEQIIINSIYIMTLFVIFNFIFFPILFWAYKKVTVMSMGTIKVIQGIYLIVVLFFGIGLTLLTQDQYQSTHVYILVLFAIAAFVYILPLESLFIFSVAYIFFAFMLPDYQPNLNIVIILRVNGLLMNIIAWIFSGMVLNMRINSFLDKKEIMKKNQELNELAIKDSMTSLYNHMHIYHRLHEETTIAKQVDSPLAIILLDIDDFKGINDKYGHLMGDKIIVRVAEILVNTCRKSDLIGRYGGEEFIIVMPNTNIKDAVILAERIRGAVEKAEFAYGIGITVSGGIKEYQGDTAEELINAADTQLYKAKLNGKNRLEAAGLT